MPKATKQLQLDKKANMLQEALTESYQMHGALIPKQKYQTEYLVVEFLALLEWNMMLR